MLTEYRRRFPAGYRFEAAGRDGRDRGRSGWPMALVYSLLLRRRMAYRPIDRLLLSSPVTRLQLRVVHRLAARLPGFVDRQGMTSSILMR
jgi:hypothetical protein